MKKLFFLFSILFLNVMAYSQDGLAYWSAAEGWKFDFNADGVIDLQLPTQTKDIEISEVFVIDANMDGIFDLCEIDRTDGMIRWHFHFNDGNNNFPNSQVVEFGIPSADKVLAGDFNADGIIDVAIRRDNDYGLWWIIHFMGVADDVNLPFGIADDDFLLTGDFNNDGVDDIAVYNKGRWQVAITPDQRPALVADIDNLQFGTSNDIPVAGDFDGDGYADMGLMSVADREISINLHNTSKSENYGYSNNGRGSFDMTIDMPQGINPTAVCSVKKDQIPEGSVNSIGTISNHSIESKLSPNPINRGGQTQFYSEALENGTIYSIEILSVSGQLVAGNAIVCSDNTLTIPSFSLNLGTYLVRVNVEGEYIVKKLLIY